MRGRHRELHHRLRDWCENQVQADDTSVNETVNREGELVVECSIRSGNDEIMMSVDENQSGRVHMFDSPQSEGEKWDGEFEEIDLHPDGATIATDKSTFSFTWDDR